jgi:hypothetical protein
VEYKKFLPIKIKYMKILITIAIFLFFYINIIAQNIGMGTSTPTTNLEIKKAIKSTVKISSANYLDTTQLIFSNRNSLNEGTDMQMASNRETGLRFSSSSDIGFNNKDTIMQITPTGNVGIRTGAPQYPLDVKGDINTSGLMRINGNPGAAGQVLTSSGNSANPAWSAAAFSNNTRFSFGFTSYGANRVFDSVSFSFTRYNTNTLDISINASTSRIAINKTGLYHFEIGYYVEIASFTPAFDNMYIIWELLNNASTYIITSNYKLSNFGTVPTTQFFGGQRVSIDLYCLAGSSIKLTRFFNPGPGGSPTTFSFGDLTGYLIAE